MSKKFNFDETFGHILNFALQLEDILKYFMLKRIKHLNFRIKNIDFDEKLHIGKKTIFDQFFSQNSKFFFYSFKFRSIAPKLKDILEYFMRKSIKHLSFHAKNMDFDTKLHVGKKLVLTNFSIKIHDENEFQYFAYLKLNFFGNY